MTAEEWERIKNVFYAALNASGLERDAYLDDACRGQPELRQTVERLLANHGNAKGFLEEPLAETSAFGIFAPGELIARRFRITRFIKRGGMGEVYEAYDEKLRLRLALKTLRKELAADPDALERFRREIRVARSVSHDGLCRVFDLVEHQPAGGGDDAVVPCLTMELLEGETLEARLRRGRPLPIATALRFAGQIAAALDALHANGLVHRDLKPSNVMLVPAGEEERAVLTDFGLAKPLEERHELFESGRDVNAGAPYYMAPELLAGGRPTVASDIYAFGLVVDEMVTRSRAFAAESLRALMYQRMWEAPLAPSARSDNLPGHWESAILRCLAQSPDRRYGRATDVVRDLAGPAAPPEDNLEETGPHETPGELEVTRPRTRTWLRRARRRILLVILLIAFAVSGLIAANKLLSLPLDASVIVFPTENLTRQPDYDYFCKGAAAELMRRLSLVEGVRVIPYYEPRAAGVPRLPGARYLLESHLQEFGGNLRFTAQLLENEDGALVWSQNFDYGIGNPLELQTAIADRTVRAIESREVFSSFDQYGAGRVAAIAGIPMRRLLGFQAPAVPGPPTTSSAALADYMRGRALWDERTVPAALAAIRYFNAALEEDPKFALAMAALADAQFVLMDYNHAPQTELLERARRYAERAVAADPNLPEAHLSLAAVRQTLWDWEGAESSYRRAIQLNPKLARARRWYAGLKLQFARFDEALAEARTAVELDPFDYPSQSGYGLYLFYSGQYREAIEQLEGLIEKKDLTYAHIILGNVYARLASLSQGAEAAALFEKAFRQAGIVAEREPAGDAYRYSDEMYALYEALSGNRAASLRRLRSFARNLDSGKMSPVSAALVETALGDHEAALGRLETAFQSKDRDLLYVKVEPFLEPLRKSRRFQTLLERMRL